METEYAPRLGGAVSNLRATRSQVYQAVLAALRRRVPMVNARHLKEGVFLATGGAVWFETASVSVDTGLIEGATPECRGPRQLLCYQRAQDRLLGQAASEAFSDQRLALIKNDRDSQGNVYGAQENYEAQLASGWRLLLWRVGLVLLLPLALIAWCGFLLFTLGLIGYFAVAGVCYAVGSLVLPGRTLERLLFGRNFLGEDRWLATPWLGAVFSICERAITAPLALGLWCCCWLLAFAPTRRRLLPFLISRSVIAGSGWIDTSGRFHLADKAPGLNCQAAYGGFFHDRPIFTFGHFLKVLYAEACFSPTAYLALFAPRQRLQIALGDSNLCDVSEYLRIGTTLLVLDAIEAGALPSWPRFRRPLRALHSLAADPSLAARVRSTDGRQWTALELQEYYCQACRQFLQQQGDAPSEAWDVLELWERVLRELEHGSRELVGVLDWATKLYLLDQLGESDWEARKKLDLRYHELSPDGYFSRFAMTGLAERVLDDVEIERAMRTPPGNTPAATRGRYIREFADGEQPVWANWRFVFIGRGKHARRIRLADWKESPRETTPTPS